jgi:hypothetical protein
MVCQPLFDMVIQGPYIGTYPSHATVKDFWLQPELGKVTLKSNGDEALSDESPLKSNSDEASNDDFP